MFARFTQNLISSASSVKSFKNEMHQKKSGVEVLSIQFQISLFRISTIQSHHVRMYFNSVNRLFSLCRRHSFSFTSLSLDLLSYFPSSRGFETDLIQYSIININTSYDLSDLQSLHSILVLCTIFKYLFYRFLFVSNS